MKAIIDFETRSECDLKTAGAQAYAEHPSTRVMCLGWKLGDAPTRIWEPEQPFPDVLAAHIARGGIVAAHNIPFDSAIFDHVLPRHGVRLSLPLEQQEDLMARALAIGLPGKLETLGAVLKLPIQKDEAGHKLMMRMSKPDTRHRNKTGETRYLDTPEAREKLRAYCVRDVDVEALTDKMLPPLSDSERELWLIDQKINRRGVLVDAAAIEAATAAVETDYHEANAALAAVTGGAVTTVTNHRAMLEWIRSQGVEADSVAKEATKELLAGELPGDVRKALLIRQGAGNASVSKLYAMLAQRSGDNRIRGSLRYHGAATGRWSGQGWQPHNLKRPDLKQKEINLILETIHEPGILDALREFWGGPVKALASCVRGLVIPETGKEFIGGDYANIEGRALAWEAGEEWKIEAFQAYDRKEGPDLYILGYARSFGRDPATISKDDPERQIGKVQELALGYQGSVGAYVSMGANYGVTPSSIADAIQRATSREEWAAHLDRLRSRDKEFKEWQRFFKSDMTLEEWQALKFVVRRWRDAHPCITQFWWDLQDAALNAVRNPGKVFRVGPVRYVMKKHMLLCVLPSGRALCYFGAYVGSRTDPLTEETSPAVKFWSVDSQKKTWVPSAGYGGLWAENITQAVARDLLAGALKRLEAAGAPVVLHVHDAILLEVLKGKWSANQLADIMSQSEPWSRGLPVTVDAWKGQRYQK